VTSRHPAPSPVATAAKLPPPPLLWGGEATNPHHPVHPVSKVPIRASPVRARRRKSTRKRPGMRPCFNPRLARAGEATQPTGERQSRGACFNPRLARAGEATHQRLQRTLSRLVSIRASPVRARRPDFGIAEPGEELVSIRASPVRARRLHQRLQRTLSRLVSIRASPVRARRPSCFPLTCSSRASFNPRLARAGEATRHPRRQTSHRRGFNPRLARAGEATTNERTSPGRAAVSIRASPVRARRPESFPSSILTFGVSIRASPVRARRPAIFSPI